MTHYVTIDQAASLEKTSRSTIERWANSERLRFVYSDSKKHRGKKIKLILFESLSVQAQSRLIKKAPPPDPGTTCRAPTKSAPSLNLSPGGGERLNIESSVTLGPRASAAAGSDHPPQGEPSSTESAAAWYQSLTPQHRARVDQRLAILDSIRDQLKDAGRTIGILHALCQQHAISRSTFYNWARKYDQHGLPGLADRRFGQSRSRITNKGGNYIVALIKQNPDRRDVRLWEYHNKEFSQHKVSGGTVSRFVADWKTKNHELFTFWKNKDLWKSQYQVAFGSQSEKALHFLHFVELDSTPADVMCSDDRRYSILGAIDIFARKPMVKVAPTSSGLAIASLLRSIILKWGIPETIVRDNGKDYVSNHIESIRHSLDIDHETLPPFTPEGKPHIERFFRTMAAGLFEELPGYIGHNVAQRKAIESRRSFAQRLMRQGEDPIRIDLSAQELQVVIDDWIENIYNHRRHGGIYTTPELKAAQSTEPVRHVDDERALDILLLPVGEATVQKKGIRYLNANYQSPDLAGFVKHRVQVRRDLEDAGKIYVFDSNGHYIATAWDPSIPGMPAIDYDAARKEQRRRIKAQNAAIETLTEEPIYDLIRSGKRQKIAGLPRRRTAASAALDEAKTAALEKNGIKPDRYKTIAEQMEENGWGPASDPADDFLDFIDADALGQEDEDNLDYLDFLTDEAINE